MIRTARETNEAKPDWIVERVARKAARFKNPRIACLGLAYKPDVDDLRESPAVKIAQGLIDRNIGEVWAVEPFIDEHDSIPLREIQEGVEEADIVILLVGHRQFKRMPRKWLTEKVVFDVCGLFRQND
jgi:UDP-N-acetyl-D-mannosaminuronic acid dehydrogenase